MYMHRDSGVSLVKALHFGSTKYHPSETAKLIRDQRICHREMKVDQLVDEFFRQSAKIPDYDTKTGNFRKFMMLLSDLGNKGFTTSEACRSFTAAVKEIQQYSRDDVSDPVDHFIGQEIGTIGNFLQMAEDVANAREGRQRNAGVL